jgi:hypothetical protein
MTRHLIELTPPWEKPPLSLNGREHWRVSSRVKAELKMIVANRARGIGPYGHIVVHLRWQPVVRRRRDGDNPSPTVKACVDGLVARGVVPDDTTDYVTHGPLHIIARAPGQTAGRLWLVIDGQGTAPCPTL